MTSYGYIRQSHRADLDAALSPEAQLGAIKRLAQRYGDDPDQVVILSDLGRSGSKERSHLRAAYQELVRIIESNGHGTTIYALSMSRLARSLTELTKIFSIASDHNVRIIFEKEGEVRFDTPIGKLHATITGAVYEFERELSVERQRDNIAVRRARGDRMGREPYSNPQAVLDAYKESTSINATARLLNSRGILSREGKAWGASSVRSVLRGINPDLIQKTGRGRAPKTKSFRFYHLLRCHCGTIMTGSHDGERVEYRCHRKEADPAHTGPATVSEHKLIPYFEEEIGDLTNLILVVDTPIDQTRVDELNGKKARVIEAFIDGVIDKHERDARFKNLDDELDKLQTRETVLPVPPLDDEPQAVNEFLKGLFGTVQLNNQMQPVFGEWKIGVKSLRDKIPTPSVLRLTGEQR